MSDGKPHDTTKMTGEQLREEQMVLRTLVKHPGWELVARCAIFQMAQYQRAALAPIQSMDAVPDNEYKKGIAQGIQEMLSIPEQVLEEIETELATHIARAKAEGEDDGGPDDC